MRRRLSSIPTVNELQQVKCSRCQVPIYSFLRLSSAGGQAPPDDSPNDVHQPGELPLKHLQLHSILTCIAHGVPSNMKQSMQLQACHAALPQDCTVACTWLLTCTLLPDGIWACTLLPVCMRFGVAVI